MALPNMVVGWKFSWGGGFKVTSLLSGVSAADATMTENRMAHICSRDSLSIIAAMLETSS
jgi:hypothetical protein